MESARYQLPSEESSSRSDVSDRADTRRCIADIGWLVTNLRARRDEKAIFEIGREHRRGGRGKEEATREELEEMDLTVDRVGAGSLARVNGRVMDKEREREKERNTGDAVAEERNTTERHTSAARSRFVCVVHDRQRDRESKRENESAPPAYSKRTTSLRLEECGNRLSRSCISILPSTHRANARARDGAGTHTYTHIRTGRLHKRLAPSFSLSLSFPISVPRPHAHTAN